MESTTDNNTRYTRNATLISQRKLNRSPVAIVGIGAIGSHLAPMLCKMGVTDLTLIDFDTVDAVNLSVQGFNDQDLGEPKARVVAANLYNARDGLTIRVWTAPYARSQILENSIVFTCVDNMDVRKEIFHDFEQNPWTFFLDCRMSAETLSLYSVTRKSESTRAYRDSLFPQSEAHADPCTARATVYCASLAAALLCSQFKKMTHAEPFCPYHYFDLRTMDLATE